MASGVIISDEVVELYNEIRVRHHGYDEKERLKLVIMRLSEDQKAIVVDHSSTLKNKDLENEKNVFQKIVSMLPEKDCRYALYDCCYETSETQKEDLVFIMWAPDDAPVNKKMVYASSKGGLKNKLKGLKFEWQVNDEADKEMASLVDKLGGNCKIKSLEGKCI
ncbi:non-muscle cofilin 1-like [Neoarius graeffei]|uniref:non-muscle cofilin 1-like n=1 Tax=Neoarius graeffei TaxID=443677 RepID=UPI00298CB5A5|nr:non-muscle cofilin 1-like [Neoarius graeffei]